MNPNSLEKQNRTPYSDRGYPTGYPGSAERYRAPRPYRYGMALAGFILGLAGMLSIATTFILLLNASDSDPAAVAIIGILSVPLSLVFSVVGLILSIIAVRSSRGAGYAIAGISLTSLSLLGGALFMLLLLIGALASL
ncbi:hypothetical protein [Saccharibacillus alkalitolerans]|uniref:DUF4190 domain-containing protein n=1 Tax=Saccharibacillus alkalitolerans TaxID=2705290 RepID=A0ABX0F075_9BACL|nr:hypothetical protein [Saccharibacillus alkalitolerans]NGZ74393.1 hypothetical protein [Saccharibacillus alkalitolerans]